MGCLLGLAVGDALGAPLEFMDADQIEAQHGRVREMLGGGWLKLKPGEWTDDTAQALIIAESYIENNGCDFQDIADRLLEWYQGNPPDVGNLTRGALEGMQQGYQFERASREAWEATAKNRRLGNGSLMRAAPTGLARYHDDIHLIGESRVISALTHYDETCRLACTLLNMAIAHLLLVGIDGLLHELTDFITPRNASLANALAAIPALRPDELRTTGYVVDTLQAALWAVIYPTDFEEALVIIVNRGDDADTVGAVAGALLGTRFGAEAIPARWLDVLSDRRRIDETARLLYRFSQQG